MQTLSLFNFNGHEVRVVTIDGTAWWVAVDVCRALGLTTAGGATRHLTNLNQDEVGRWRPTAGKYGRRPNATISESGLYKLIMRSDKPEARAFQDWVTRVVLPAIRKDGAYIMGEEKFATGEMSADG